MGRTPTVFLVALLSCARAPSTGQDGAEYNSERVEKTPKQGSAEPPENNGGSPPPGPGALVVKGPVSSDALSVRTPELLPFSMRIKKLAYALEVETTDPRLVDYFQQRTELGDHNHALGISADSAWAASRMETWAKLTLATCRSFPASELVSLATRALGKEGLEFLLEVQGELDAVSLPNPMAREQLACTALLTSGEFLLR